MRDEHQHYLTDQYSSLTQQIITLRKQHTDETSEENKSELEALMKILKKKRDEIDV